MSFKIIDVDPWKSPQDMLDKYFEFFDKLQLEQSPKDPLTPKHVQLQRIKVEREGEIRIRKAAISEETDEVIANLYMEYFTEGHFEYEKNKHITYLTINVLKEFKESDAPSDLLKLALEILKQTDQITLIETCTTRQIMWEFWEGVCAKFTLDEDVNRLYLDDANWDLMEKWVKEGRDKAQEENIELLAFKDCPEGIIDEYTTLYSKIMEYVPFGESDWTPSIITAKDLRENEKNHKERGFDWWVLVTKENDGTLSGLTEIFSFPDTPHWVAQELTGVHPDQTGRGLGKWLKAEMLFYIKEKLPKTIFIRTGNADYNAPMVSINKRMGFKQHLTEKCYKIKLEKLEKNLE